MIPYQNALKQVSQGETLRCCLLTGDSFLIKEFTAAIAKGLAVERLAGSGLTLGDVLHTADQPSLLASQRLLLLENVSYFSSKKGYSPREEEKLQAFLSAAGDPAAIIVFTASSIDKRLKPVKAIEKSGWFVDCRPPKGNHLNNWINNRFKQLKVKADMEAVRELAFRCGKDLELMERECEKLAVYLNPGETLTRQIVSLLITVSGEADVFALTDAIGESQLDRAQEEFNRLISQGHAPVYVLHMVARHFRLLYHYSLAEQEGMGDANIASLMGLHPFVAKKLNQQHRKMSVRQLEAQLLKLSRLDEQIKTGVIDPVLGLGLFIAGIK